MKKVYRFEVKCGRAGDLRGTFVVADDADVERAIGKPVSFDEPWGKHSECVTTLKSEHFTVLTDDQDFIAKFETIGIRSQGHCPIGLLADQESDGTTAALMA